ncbi:hypothetical protein [Nonomuraea sp. bgisy101]|uniref:hypothetical protein n=1 Tax=Nonomuraea sp. bgisy101 TaxID=3413784 RepID=UPI003D739A69
MLAEDFGYRVLPGAAIDTPGVDEVLRGRERGLRVGLVVLAVEALALALVAVREGPGSAAAVALAVVLLVTAGPVLLWRRARRKERAIMTTYGWQVWPCAVEVVRVVAAEGRRERGRRWAHQSRVVLLRPDGQAQCSFPPPDEGARPGEGGRPGGGAGLGSGAGSGNGGRPREGGRPDEGAGAGQEVWFAGDTRFGGMLAAPGGLPFRYVTRTRPGRAKASPEEDRAAATTGLMPRSWRPGGLT